MSEFHLCLSSVGPSGAPVLELRGQSGSSTLLIQLTKTQSSVSLDKTPQGSSVDVVPCVVGFPSLKVEHERRGNENSEKRVRQRRRHRKMSIKDGPRLFFGSPTERSCNFGREDRLASGLVESQSDSIRRDSDGGSLSANTD